MSSILLFDRSRATTDWTCPRKRYLNYELDGVGIVPDREPLELMMGTIVHDSLAQIAYESTKTSSTVTIDVIASEAHGQMWGHLLPTSRKASDFSAAEVLYAHEQSALVEGMIRGFYRYQWPILLKQFPKLLAIEQEMSYSYEGVTFMCKPDLVAATPEGEVVYIEYKTTSNKREEWVNAWGTAIQLHATTRAIEAALKESISHVVVQGLYKGYESYGKQSSPFCYAYKRTGNPPFSRDEISYEYKAGLKRTPVWELDGGVKGWVGGMPEAILASQFPSTPPIFVNDSMVEAFFQQRLYREKEIQLAGEMLAQITDPESRAGILNVAFPQRFDQCQTTWGRPCEFQRICHGSVDRPLEQGFKARTAHHAIELEANDVNVG